MKLFTGSLAAGLVLLAGGAQAQVPGPYDTRRHRTFDAPYAAAPQPVPGPHYDPGRATDTARACCRRRKSIPCCAITASRRSASPGSAASSTRSRRSIAAARTAGWLSTRATAGSSASCRPTAWAGQLLRGAERPPRALHGSAAAGPSAQAQAPDHVQAAPQPSRPAPCREPHGADAEGQPARRQTRRTAPVKQAAAPAPKPAEVQAAAPVTTGSAPAKPAPQIAPTQDMPTTQGLE